MLGQGRGPVAGEVQDLHRGLAAGAPAQGRELAGGEVEVLIDTNAKRAYEAGYWQCFGPRALWMKEAAVGVLQQ